LTNIGNRAFFVSTIRQRWIGEPLPRERFSPAARSGPSVDRVLIGRSNKSGPGKNKMFDPRTQIYASMRLWKVAKKWSSHTAI
jgi:hypothetical protein